MRNALLSIIFIVTFSCVIFLLWRQRTRHLAYVKANADGFWDNGDGSHEKRRFKRFKLELPVECTITEKQGDTYKTFSKDISGQGICCLKVPEMVPQGGVLNLLISVPDKRPIKITGEVVWVKELESSAGSAERSFNAGIRFLRIARQDQKLLDNFLLDSAR